MTIGTVAPEVREVPGVPTPEELASDVTVSGGITVDTWPSDWVMTVGVTGFAVTVVGTTVETSPSEFVMTVGTGASVLVFRDVPGVLIMIEELILDGTVSVEITVAIWPSEWVITVGVLALVPVPGVLAMAEESTSDVTAPEE
jgi:hypothetical protein